MNALVRLFLSEDEKSIKKNSSIWNMCFSLLTSFQSAIMILLVTRCVGADGAGVMSIAFAAAYLMFTIGCYGVRNFHSTDVLNKYSYRDYRSVRIVTCILMICASFVYSVFKGYQGEKAIIVFGICALKLAEVAEDLFHGELQRNGRLDIACFLGTVRLIIMYLTFGILLISGKSLIIAVMTIVLISVGFVIYESSYLRESILNTEPILLKNIKQIFYYNFPLFFTSFLNIYITNAPKYAIDSCLSNGEQAYYAVLSMPAFVINLMSGVIYRPLLTAMALKWEQHEKKEFGKMVLKQFLAIVAITIVVCVGGRLIGLRILEKLYGLQLMQYMEVFILLLISGGMTAALNFGIVCLTIIRKQKMMTALSGVTVLLAIYISEKLVMAWGLMGAAGLNMVLVLLEFVVVLVAIYRYIFLKHKNKY